MIMQSFWQDLPKPFTALAPLDGVTDMVFRQVITEIGKPDVLFTEFTMCQGLLSAGRERVLDNLLYTPEQQPIVAQIWGIVPEHFYKVAKDLQARGFAGIDLNMGCPHGTVIKHGACSALIKNPTLAAEIIQATKEGAGPDMPVSVKTRIGFKEEKIEEWIGFLLKQNLAALTVHLRTVAEMSKEPAHWEKMSEVVLLRNTIAPDTILMGNGDITSLAEMHEKFREYGCEGFMVGRGIFTNPWLFNPKIAMHEKTLNERIELYLYHISLFEKQWGGRKNFALLKKFAKTYISNLNGATDIRDNLMNSRTLEELKKKINAILKITY